MKGSEEKHAEKLEMTHLLNMLFLRRLSSRGLRELGVEGVETDKGVVKRRLEEYNNRFILYYYIRIVLSKLIRFCRVVADRGSGVYKNRLSAIPVSARRWGARRGPVTVGDTVTVSL